MIRLHVGCDNPHCACPEHHPGDRGSDWARGRELLLAQLRHYELALERMAEELHAADREDQAELLHDAASTLRDLQTEIAAGDVEVVPS